MAKKKYSNKKDSKKEIKVKKEKVCEIFEIEKDGKRKIVSSCGTEEIPISKKNQIEHQNRLLKNIFISLGIVVVIFTLTFYTIYSMYNFEYEEIKFKIIKEKDVTFYETVFPSKFITLGKTIRYHTYLRRDPRKIDYIPFEGFVNLKEMAVIDSEEVFNCEGDGVIAVANFNRILGAKGMNVVRDPEAKCDLKERYVYFYLKSGNETKIIQQSPSCYELIVNNCEILDVTERFILEVLKL